MCFGSDKNTRYKPAWHAHRTQPFTEATFCHQKMVGRKTEGDPGGPGTTELVPESPWVREAEEWEAASRLCSELTEMSSSCQRGLLWKL